MGRQRHVILRQTLELRVARQGDAWPLQEQAKQLMGSLEPIIERCCDQFSSADRLHRIERLELDLGRMDPEYWTQQLPERFAAALQRQLAEHFQRQESGGQASLQMSRWELLEHYLRYGRLPWWADEQRAGQPQESLDWLLRLAPAWLAKSMPALLADAGAVSRLAGQFPERVLAPLLEVLLPGLPGYPALLQATLLDLPRHGLVLADRPAAHYRRLVWQSLLACAAPAGSPFAGTAEAFSHAVLQRLAGLLQQDAAPLRQAFLQAAAGRAPALMDVAVQLAAEPAVIQAELNGESLSKLESLEAPQHLPAADSVASPVAEAWQALQHWLEQGAEAAPPFWLQAWPQPLRAALFTRLSSLGAGLAPALVQLSTWLERTAPEPAWLQSWPALLREELLAQLQQLAAGEPLWENARASRDGDTAIPSSASPSGAAASADGMAGSGRASPGPGPAGLAADAFSEADAVYLNNAGLVILGPFLQTFFQRQNLVQERQFRDEAARRRGMALLQCLADGGNEPPEYLLPLNKLLCGAAPDALYELDEPLSETEIAACEDLLRAAIAQAPIWRNLSIAGLRGSFLLRSGRLAVGDGVWRLQVERHTYDLVLERLPWSFSWIKLPWMAAPLQVEW